MRIKLWWKAVEATYWAMRLNGWLALDAVRQGLLPFVVNQYGLVLYLRHKDLIGDGQEIMVNIALGE